MIDIEKLLPDELENIRKIIDELLKSIIGLRITNLNYQIAKKEVYCPICKSKEIVKNGTKNKTQRYKCKSCNKFFSISSNSLTNHLRLSYSNVLVFLQSLIDNDTIEQTAGKIGLSMRETYNLRIKFISVLNKYSQNILTGIIQVDEKYLRINLKGTRKDKMPRKTHRNGFEDKEAGISDDQVCILMAIDSNDNIFAQVIGLGQITADELEEKFLNVIDSESILVTDSKKSYRKFAKKFNLNLKEIPSKKHITKENYHLGELNSLMKELDDMLVKAHGLSTRHLQEYLDYFKVRKILKYTYEYLMRNKELYNYILLQESKLTSRKVCKTDMPVNIDEHYDCTFK